MAAGAIGCSVGRNIFMHANPEAITRALSRVIRERWTGRQGARRASEEELAVMRAAFMTGGERRSRSATTRPNPRSTRPARCSGSRRAASAAPTRGPSSTGTRRRPSPWQLGHEPVGVLAGRGTRRPILPPGVAARRSGVPRFDPDLRRRAAGALEGFQNLCEHHLLYGYDPFPGAYAEVAAVPRDRDEEPDPACRQSCRPTWRRSPTRSRAR